MTELRHLIHLIDFVGHPSLNEEYLNKKRYDTLHYLLESTNLENRVITSTYIPTFLKSDKQKFPQKFNDAEKYYELKQIAEQDRGFTWIEIEESTTVFGLAEKLKEHNFLMVPEYTNVIFGGTNLGGCVLRNKNTSVYEFAKCKFRCKILLPMCAEADVYGMNDIEKLWRGFSNVYNFARDENIYNDIFLAYSVNQV